MLQGICYVANMPSVESDLEDLTSWLRQSNFSNQWNTRTSSDLRQIIDRTCASNVVINQEHVKLCADAFRLGESIVGHLNGSESAKTICQRMYGDELITPSRGKDMMNAIMFTDIVMETHISHLVIPRIRDATQAYHDNATFTFPPPELCPICSLPFSANDDVVFRVCCGKEICKGCILGMTVEQEDRSVRPACPYCRKPAYTTDKEYMDLLQKGAQAQQPNAMVNLGCHYNDGTFGLQENKIEAIKLWTKAAGDNSGNASACAAACYNLASYYATEVGSATKMMYYFKKAAYMGNIHARFALACIEQNRDNALKHFEIAAKCGHKKSMASLREAFRTGDITKDRLLYIMRDHQSAIEASSSENRTMGQHCFNVMGLRNGIPDGEQTATH